jgi:hypothetical protein
MLEHYQAVLADLTGKRDRVARELKDLDAGIAAIQRLMGPATSPSISPSAWAPPSEALPGSFRAATTVRDHEPAINYNAMSLRWAVLAFLSDVATEPMGTGQIAEALRERGIQRETQSPFGNVVSAVLSNLKAKGEVTTENGLHVLTDAGRSMWNHIKHSQKFRDAQAGGQSLLDQQH